MSTLSHKTSMGKCPRKLIQDWSYRSPISGPSPARNKRSLPTTACESYQLTVQGTYFTHDGIYADAKYSSRYGSPWSDSVQNYESNGPALLDLQRWEPTAASYVSPDWGPYSSSHTCFIRWKAYSSALTFRINDTYASNNSGFLTVTAYQVWR